MQHVIKRELNTQLEKIHNYKGRWNNWQNMNKLCNISSLGLLSVLNYNYFCINIKCPSFANYTVITLMKYFGIKRA